MGIDAMLRACLLTVLLILLTGCDVLDASPIMGEDTQSSPDSVYTLTDIYYARQTVQDLQALNVISEAIATEQIAFYTAQTVLITGEALSQTQIEDRIFSSPFSRWQRVLTFVNLLWFAGSIIIVLALGWLFAIYVYPILKKIPIWFYELLAYFVCAGLIVIGRTNFSPDVGQFVAMPAVLSLIGLLPFTYRQHFVTSSKIRPADPNDPNAKEITTVDSERERLELQILNAILTFIWGTIAIWYDSQIIGVFAVGACITFLGISGAFDILFDAFNLKRKDGSLRVLLVTGLMTLVYITGEILDWSGAYRVFETGVYWVGTYIFFVALGAKSSRWYLRKEDSGAYLRWQIITVVISLTLVFVGIVWELDAVQETSGTFLAIYLFGKYIELLNWKRYWAWGLLGLGILLYSLGLLVNQYPEFFLLA
ncbi:MAG: hypothetical protein AAFQ52_13505 [Chloroflexota bacterium]